VTSLNGRCNTTLSLSSSPSTQQFFESRKTNPVFDPLVQHSISTESFTPHLANKTANKLRTMQRQ